MGALSIEKLALRAQFRRAPGRDLALIERAERRLAAKLASFFAVTARHVSRQISEHVSRETLGKAARLVGRDAFLYMEPPQDAPQAAKDQFAQCGTCWKFRPKRETCSEVLGKIVAGGSCGTYAYGASRDEQPQRALLTQAMAGYVVRQVRCENCRYLNGLRCGWYAWLNERFPGEVCFEEAVNPKGCCNAQMPGDNDVNKSVGALLDVDKSSEHSGGIDLHVRPENAEPIHGIPVADVVTRANVMHISWEMVPRSALPIIKRLVPLDSLIAEQEVVDRQRVLKHMAALGSTGETEPGQNPPLVLLWDGDYFILGGHHGLQAAYDLGVREVLVDVMEAP